MPREVYAVVNTFLAPSFLQCLFQGMWASDSASEDDSDAETLPLDREDPDDPRNLFWQEETDGPDGEVDGRRVRRRFQ